MSSHTLWVYLSELADLNHFDLNHNLNFSLITGLNHFHIDLSVIEESIHEILCIIFENKYKILNIAKWTYSYPVSHIKSQN